MGFLQARKLEGVAIPFSRGPSQPREQIQVSSTASSFFTICATGALCVMEPLVHFNLPYTLVNLVKSHLKCAFLLKFSYVTPFWGDAGIWWPESLVKGKRVLGSLLGAFQEQLGRLWP